MAKKSFIIYSEQQECGAAFARLLEQLPALVELRREVSEHRLVAWEPHIGEAAQPTLDEAEVGEDVGPHARIRDRQLRLEQRARPFEVPAQPGAGRAPAL